MQQTSVRVYLTLFSTGLHSVMMNQDRITLNFFRRHGFWQEFQEWTHSSVKNRGLHHDPVGPDNALRTRTGIR